MHTKLSGFASVEATELYFKGFTNIAHNVWASGLRVSQCGVGTYRMGLQDEHHQHALKKALSSGVNLIDTSTNYMNGSSEQLVGNVLNELCHHSDYNRSQFVIVSKVGYIQGDLLQQVQALREEGAGYSDIVEMNEGLLHCIHPDFIRDQLTHSLDRLGVETLDYLLLHNPEYYLDWGQNHEKPLSSMLGDYYERLDLAFKYLEDEVANGRIKAYGVSSNTLPLSDTHYTFTSLSRIMDLVEAFPNPHHLKMVQFPMNLLEPSAATEHNQDNGDSLLHFANQKQLTTLVNRPLNAFRNGVFMRLVTYRALEGIQESEVLDRIDQLLELAEQFYTEIFPNLYAVESEKQILDDLFDALASLKDHILKIDTFAQWKDMMQHFFYPRVDHVVQKLFQDSHSENEMLQDWIKQYLIEMEQFFELVSKYYMAKTNIKSGGMLDLVSRTSKEWRVDGSLASTAVRALRSTEGVSAVLVGMRRVEYVEEMVSELCVNVPLKDRSSTWTILDSF